ncbi:hypothetical protein ACIBL6_05005 [Streptomyces sp. NPDC050400]|uniref:hypothetical protein n=1 Tax=Streptomyces sp. NPDC050400 TaxID=3365610 RepID=UPI0037B30904
MDLEKPPPAPVAPVAPAAPPDGCLVAAIRMPVRIVVFVVVVPVRLVWDALVAGGRLLHEKVLVPLARGIGWLLYGLLVWPFVALWRYVLAPVGRVLIVVPARWLYARVLTPLGRAIAFLGRAAGLGLAWLGRALFVWPWVALWQYVLVPVGHGLAWLARQLGAGLEAVGRGIGWLLRVLLVVPAVWLYTYLLTPVGRAIAALCTGVGIAVAWLARVLVAVPAVWLYANVLTPLVRWLVVLPVLAVWRWVLVPVGRALAVLVREVGEALGHAWRVAGYVSLAVGRFLGRLLRWVFVDPVRWAYRTVLTPVGHAVRDQVWRPVARATRQALGAARDTFRQARADLRRALFGLPRQPEPLVRGQREPGAAEARTLGSSTTALTKTAFIKD